MSDNNITLVVALDDKTLKQFRVSHHTWHRFHPELWEWPWLVIYDDGQIDYATIRNVMDIIGVRNVTLTPLCRGDLPEYQSQRERMLTSFVYVPPKWVTTPWWMKLDTDAVAVRYCDHWLDPKWFNETNAYVASSWAYSKAKGGGGDIRAWAARLESWGDSCSRYPPLGLEERIVGEKIKVGRMASWISFYRTDWTKELAESCRAFAGEQRLPVPSQDTCAWYFAARRHDQQLTIRRFGKRKGWTNCPRFEGLCRKVEEAMKS